MPANPDQLAGLADDGSASATAPALSAADIETIKASLQADFDARIAGFQSKVIAPRDQTIEALRAELRELKTGVMSDDEREQFEEDELRKENESLKARMELMELRGTYGDLIPVYEQLLGASSAEEQLKLLQGLRAPAAPVVPDEPADADKPDDDASDIDPNRPPRRLTQGGTVMPDGTAMTDEIADQLLASRRTLRG